MANAICLMYTESYSYIADPSHRTLLLSRHRWDKPPRGEECTTLQPVIPYWCGIMFFSSGGKNTWKTS